MQGFFAILKRIEVQSSRSFFALFVVLLSTPPAVAAQGTRNEYGRAVEPFRIRLHQQLGDGVPNLSPTGSDDRRSPCHYRLDREKKMCSRHVRLLLMLRPVADFAERYAI